MRKIKGWKAEQRIDDYLHHDKVRSSMCEPARLLIQAKTLISSLRKENKDIEEFYKGWLEDKDWRTKYLEMQNRDVFVENEKLKKQNKEMFEQHQDYFEENEKLKQELSEYKKFGLDKDLKELEKLK